MKKFWGLMACVCCLCASAAVGVKLDVDGRDSGVALTAANASSGIRVAHPKWLKEHPDQYLCFEGGSLAGEWKTFRIGFTPSGTGKIKLALRGTFVKRPKASWVAYDNFKITGAKLENPSFDELKDGLPVGWARSSIGCGLLKNGSAGGVAVAGSHNGYWSQTIGVTAGTPVTLEFSARFDRDTADQAHPFAVRAERKAAPAPAPAISIKRDLSRAATIRMEIDARQFGSKITHLKASPGLMIRPDEKHGEDKYSYVEVVGVEPPTNGKSLNSASRWIAPRPLGLFCAPPRKKERNAGSLTMTSRRPAST